MITDGEQTKNGKKGPYTPLKDASQPLKDKGIELWAIGIGKGFDAAELEAITSDQNKVLVVTSFDKLNDIIEDVQKVSCAGVAMNYPEHCTSNMNPWVQFQLKIDSFV